MNHTYFLALSISLASCVKQVQTSNIQPTPFGWTPIRIEGQTLHFKNGTKFTTNIYNLRYISQLQTIKKAPYLILSGTGCIDCDSNISIYIVSPSDGPMQKESRQPRYVYPGQIIDEATKKIMLESKVFLGLCSNQEMSSVIWLQRSIDINGQFHYATLTITVEDDTLKEKINVTDSTFNFSNKNPDTCIPIIGMQQMSEN